MKAGGMKDEKKTVRKKLQENVNHSANRCGETGERRENQWESMSNHPVRESIRRREQERETASEREKRERKPKMRRQTTSEMMHPTMDYHRLLLQPGIIPQRIDLGKWRGELFTEASGLADYPVGKILYPIGCGESAQWHAHPSQLEQSNSFHYQA